MRKKVWTLTEIAKLLKQPQHRLIYFCEADVIVPDGKDASGRGSSRTFSARNFFEFDVVLTLWKFHIPASMTRKVILVLNSFQSTLQRSIPEFELPYSLRLPDSPIIRAYLINGSDLYFVVGDENNSTLIGNIDLETEENNIDWPVINKPLNNLIPSVDNAAILPEGSKRAFFEINLTQIARDLPI